MNPAISGICLGILLVLDFLFSATYASLSNVRRQDLRDLAEHGNKRAAQAFELAENSSRTLVTFQAANVITRFLIAGLAAVLLLGQVANWLETSLPALAGLGPVLSFFFIIPLMALLVYLLSELLPQVLGQRFAQKWVLAFVPFTQVALFLLSPIVYLISLARRGFAGPLGDELEGALVTEEKIKTMVDAGEEDGSIDLDEKEMIYSIFELDETLAREIMVPRIDIVALDISTPLGEAREVIIRAGHSRIPVYEESLDHISGLLYAKDLLNVWHAEQEAVDLRTLLREALFVPESKRVSDLLRELQSEKVHLAIVIDEYGGTAGLVTIEDIVEEIVGEIVDEYDFDEEAAYEEVSDDEFIVDARMDIDDFNHLLDVALPDDLSDTLGGFIYGQLGKVPEVGETVKTERLHMQVLSVENQRIGKVRIKRILPSLEVLESKAKNSHVSNEGR